MVFTARNSIFERMVEELSGLRRRKMRGVQFIVPLRRSIGDF